MNRSRFSFRRLILGLSIEDAQSKFDTPESRNLLRVAHERYNQGIYHELQVAQRQRNGLAPERKCHISRFTKPSISGFQAYIKDTPDDYVIREIWDDCEDAPVESVVEEPAAESSSLAHRKEMKNSVVISSKIMRERNEFKNSKTLVLNTLTSALQLVTANVLTELKERRQSGALISKDHQVSVVDRLVGEVAESTAKGYKSLSSSSHLLEPVEMAVTLFGRKDTAELHAFKNPLLAVPAPEGDISYSLWVAGGIIADNALMQEFPFHVAKFITPNSASAASSNRLPHVEVEIYFSPELFQLEKSIGQSGVFALRQFIGRTMMKQHEPSPTSSSLLLGAAGEEERALYSIYDPLFDNSCIQIPWIRKVTTKVSTVTGVVFSTEDSDENPSADRMRAAVTSVWRAWGHLVKDLHVHGDLDFLYVSISRLQEYEGNEEYIEELKELKRLEVSRDNSAAEGTPLLPETSSSARALGSLSLAAYNIGTGTPGSRKRYVPLPSDFVVVECTLERKGLPHNMVMEDITKTLTDMQHEQLEIQRLSILDAIDADADDEGKEKSNNSPNADVLVPVLYEPKIAVSHSGMLENGTHSFQRIRIRGSCRAHVEALMASLQDETGDYFTDRSLPSPEPTTAKGQVPLEAQASSSALVLPKNLSFQAVRARKGGINGTGQGLIGHTVPSAAAVSNKEGNTALASSLHARSQVLTLAPDDSTVVTSDERQFWKENYYRLSDVKVVYHNRVDAEDVMGKSVDSLPPRVKEHLALVNRRLSQKGDGAGSSADSDVSGAEGSSSASAAAEKRKGKKGSKKKGKRNTKADKKPHAAAAAPPNLPPEKLFEYLCTDMEAESTGYDLRVGDCVAYDYLLNLRRIPDKHLPLVHPAVTSVAAKGFINYYGPQRFATYTKMNMHPGLHLLKGEYKAAAHILVQQFYIDAALEAERHRTGQAFPRMQALQGYGGARLPDFLRSGTRRSVAEHGSPMQKVLYNALQASALISGDDDGDVISGGLNGHDSTFFKSSRRRDNSAQRHKQRPMAPSAVVPTAGINSGEPAESVTDDDPCAEAFLRVIGPRACAMLIQEFLCFVWNDIANQRFQRYGTFTLLPGDLVRRGGVAAGDYEETGGAAQPVYASRTEIERGVYTPYDLLLPLPGAHIHLPQNHTEDLYVVTLQRYGLPFDPESRQWQCFSPSHLPRGNSAKQDSGVSPYFNLTSTFALMEEELGTRTPYTDALFRHAKDGSGPSSLLPPLALPGDAEVEDEGFNAADLRPDLRPLRGGGGNTLGLTLAATYRHPLVLPEGEKMQWRLLKGAVGDPYRRWGLATRAALVGANEATATSLRLYGATPPAAAAGQLGEPDWSSSASTTTPAVKRVAAAVPRLPNVESGEAVEDEIEADMPAATLAVGAAPAKATMATTTTGDRTTGECETAASSSGSSHGAASVVRSPAAVKAVAVYRSPKRWSGVPRLSRTSGFAHTTSGEGSGREDRRRSRYRRAPLAPSWLPRHHGSVLQLHLRLPAGVYPGMLLRELLKMDVSTPDIVDLDRIASSRTDRRARSWQELTPDQQSTYQQWIAKRRQQRRFVQRPRAIGLALLHQQIFRSGGVRRSLLPTLRSYDSVSK
jgi:tRNA(Glu) U13 pseudouridine synthase TruD